MYFWREFALHKGFFLKFLKNKNMFKTIERLVVIASKLDELGYESEATALQEKIRIRLAELKMAKDMEEVYKSKE